MNDDPVRARAREEAIELRKSLEHWRARATLPGAAGRAARRAYGRCLEALWREESLADPTV